MPDPSPANAAELCRRLEKVTRWRKGVNENLEDAQGNKELSNAEKKCAKEVARCLAEGGSRRRSTV